MQKILENLLSPIDKNARKTALKLTQKFGDIYNLAIATDDAILTEIDGKTSTLVYIRLAIILAARRIVDGFKLGKRHTREEISEYFKALFINCSIETLYVMATDKDGKVIAVDYAGEGTVSLSGLLPRKLLDIATRRGAKGIIIAHNHPRGYAEPSDDDIRSTAHLRDVLSSVGVMLIDHYIIAGPEYRYF